MWPADGPVIAALQDRIGRILARTLSIEAPAVETDLFETGVLDSLAFVELLVQLEQAFGIAISVDDLEVEHFRSIGCIAQFVSTHGASNGSPAQARILPLAARR